MCSAERSQFQSGHKLLALQGLRSMNLAPLMANEANSVVTEERRGYPRLPDARIWTVLPLSRLIYWRGGNVLRAVPGV